MTTVNVAKFTSFLEQVAEEIDIPPGKYQTAVERYLAVGNWLKGGDRAGYSIYPQGSFRLGTVVRPIRNGIEASYDIDLVCEMPQQKSQTTPKSVKASIGNRLKEHATYKEILDPEGRRCWTLEYAEQDNVGFHLDVLPAVPDPGESESTAIAITHKEQDSYSWLPSDPRGYGRWFDMKNASAFRRVEREQKIKIQQRESKIYASVDSVPDQLVRTPLQRAIQLMKRHRDLRFNDPKLISNAPISVIITTLAAHLYNEEPTAYSALANIANKLHGYAALVEGKVIDIELATKGLIQRKTDGKWYVGNPVNPEENFADRWHEDNHARAKAFFSWVKVLHADLLEIPSTQNLATLKESLSRSLGAPAVSKHFDTLVPPAPIIETPPRIHISDATKPWRRM